MATRTASAIDTGGLVDRERLREALALLREAMPRGATRQELAERLGKHGVSLRSVDRIITLLEKQGARMDRERSGQPAVIHFLLRKGPDWDEHVSMEARLALRLANLFLAQSGTLLWQDKFDTLEALANKHMSTRDRSLFERLQQAIQVQGGFEDPIESPDILEPILRALEGGKEIEVEYKGAGAGEPTTRRFVPFALTHDLFSGAAFLAVWDPGEQKPKHLRLSRIETLKVSMRPGTISQPETMAQAARFQIGGWICGDAPFEITLRIKGTHWIQAFKEAPPALPDFEANLAEDRQSVTVHFKANHPNGASRWILQFGDCAKVLEPTWLKDEIHAQLKRAGEQYSN